MHFVSPDCNLFGELFLNQCNIRAMNVKRMQHLLDKKGTELQN